MLVIPFNLTLLILTTINSYHYENVYKIFTAANT